MSDFLAIHCREELEKRIRESKVWTPPDQESDQEGKAQAVPAVPAVPPMTAEEAATLTGELLEQCRAWIRRYIVLSDEQAVIMAAWLLHTYAFNASETTPYIHITAPEKECGKSRLMEALAALAATPIRSGGMTAAALVRTIEAKEPTIFLDEMDAQLGANKEFSEAVRGILNEGFRKGGVFHKCAPNTFELQEFNVYCPKCFAGIGQLPDTVSGRSIVIEMPGNCRGETVEPFRQRTVRTAAEPMKRELEEWVARGVADLLRPIEPASIASLNDRQNDTAEPLLAIAQLAGYGWLSRLTRALITVFGSASADGAFPWVSLCCATSATSLTSVPSLRSRPRNSLPRFALSKVACGLNCPRAWDCQPTSLPGNSRSTASIPVIYQ